MGEKSRWLTQSVEWSRVFMSPGFSPLGPGSRRMVKRTSGRRAARRRSIIWPLLSGW